MLNNAYPSTQWARRFLSVSLTNLIFYTDIVQEIAICALQYKTNLCASNPIPAMIQQCGNWETCMNRDPAIVGRAKVGAELIAEVVNGFIEPISWKALVKLFYNT